MTKEQILEYFKDINVTYNECTRYDDLSKMIDELTHDTVRGLAKEIEEVAKDADDPQYKMGLICAFSIITKHMLELEGNNV